MAAAAAIPVIDVSSSTGKDQETVARELTEAAIEHGFLYIKNTGSEIPIEMIDEVFGVSKKLFASPLEEKKACSTRFDGRGYAALTYQKVDPNSKGAGDYMESFNFASFRAQAATQPVPPSISSHEQAILSTFWTTCYALALKLNRLLGIGLRVHPTDFFERAHLPPNHPSSSSSPNTDTDTNKTTPINPESLSPNGTTLRLAYYPHLTSTTANPTTDIRCGAHSDFGALTLLFRLPSQAGLEIETDPNLHTFAPVPVSPPGTEMDPAPPILVNIGDLLSYWTGGLLRSTVHRVVFPGFEGVERRELPGERDVVGEARYSVAFFVHPADETELGTVPSERVGEFVGRQGGGEGGEVGGEGGKRAITAGDHLAMRVKGSYPTLGKDTLAVV